MLERGKNERGVIEIVDTESLVPAAAKRYQEELLAEINADREAHGKKPFDDGGEDKPPKSGGKKRGDTSKKKLARRKKAGLKTVTKSTTDPDCGVFVKGKHQRQFAYEVHTACGKNGYVPETAVAPGNVHDSVAFDDVYDKVTESFPQIQTIVADSAYKTPHICKTVLRHIWTDYEELADDARYTPKYQGALRQTQRDHRAGLCRRQRKTRHAL